MALEGVARAVVGLDVGHSATKITFDVGARVGRFLYPSLAAPAIRIQNAEESRRVQKETVLVGDQEWFVGDTARIQSRDSLALGLNSEWISTPAHYALMARARSFLDEQGVGVPAERVYVLGLPVSEHARQKEALRRQACDVFGVSETQVFVLPQPMGGYYSWMLGREGTIQPGRRIHEESWCLIDIGYYSTDISTVVEGRWVERASGTCPGMRLAVERLREMLAAEQLELDTVDAERAYREKRFRNYGQELDLTEVVESANEVVLQRALDLANRLLGEHFKRSIHGVLLTGGGAAVAEPAFKERFPHTTLMVDQSGETYYNGPRFLVSEGYYRYGRSQEAIRLMQQKN